MGRIPRCSIQSTKQPYSISKQRGRRSKRPSSPTLSPLLTCEFSPDGERLTFHLRNQNSYTISPAESSPEHFWGTIYSAEWSHPDTLGNCTCAIKASDFLLRQYTDEDSRKEYRRPRQDFE